MCATAAEPTKVVARNASRSIASSPWMGMGPGSQRYKGTLGPALLELELEPPDDALLPLFDQ